MSQATQAIRDRIAEWKESEAYFRKVGFDGGFQRASARAREAEECLALVLLSQDVEPRAVTALTEILALLDDDVVMNFMERYNRIQKLAESGLE
jgi:hypothetical protein